MSSRKDRQEERRKWIAHCLAWNVSACVCGVCMAVVHLVLMVLVLGSEAGSERQRENRSGGGSGLAVVHCNSGR